MKLDGIIKKNSFIILDVSLKIFTLLFTLIANHILEKSDFNELSYFRTSLTMAVGLVSTALGFYILTYFHDSKNNKLDFSSFLSTVLTCYIFGTALSLSIIVLFSSELHLSTIISNNIYFYLSIVLFAITSQILIFFMKVTHALTNVIRIYIFIIFFVSIFSFFSISYFNNIGAYWSLFLFYISITFLFLYSISNPISETLKTNLGWQYVYPFGARFRQFLIPNYLESFLSVPRSWLTIFIFIEMIGFESIGDILLIQMLLGLFVFVIQSIVMNEYDRVNITSINSRDCYIRVVNKKIDALILVFIFTVVLFWDIFKDFLNITQMSDLSILIFCLSTILQVKIIPFGMLYKRMEYAKTSFGQNLFFTVALIISVILCLKYIGIEGYTIAFLVSWCLTMSLIYWQSYQIKLARVSRSTLNSIFLCILLIIGYYIRNVFL